MNADSDTERFQLLQRYLLVSGDSDTAWQGFRDARRACMQYHVAEEVAYMNDQPLFELEVPDRADRD